jgi:hypothetical protein
MIIFEIPWAYLKNCKGSGELGVQFRESGGV